MTSPLLTPEEQAYALVRACRLPANIHAPDVYCHAQLVKVVAWLEEPCREHEQVIRTSLGFPGFICPSHRKYCPKCMESLKELVKP